MGLIFKLLFLIIKFGFIIFCILFSIGILIYWVEEHFDYISYKRVENKKQKSIQKKLNKKRNRKVKKDDSLNYDALKFEYSELYEIIKQETEKLKILNSDYVISDIYLLNMHKYYQKIEKFCTKSSILIAQLACFYKAVIEEPIFIKINSKSYDFDNLNKELIDNVINVVKQDFISNIEKDSLIMLLIKYYKIYKNDTYMIAYFITDKIM